MLNTRKTPLRAVILAAGQGKRMQPLTSDRPKCLLPVGNTTVMGRLLEQLESQGVGEVTVIAGFAKDKVHQEVSKYQSDRLKIDVIENDEFEKDINILSLTLAFRHKSSPFYLFEGDILFDNEAIARIFDSRWTDQSVWFTHGRFNSSQYGGILRTDASGMINDIRIVPKYEDQFSGYKKLIGAMKIGPGEFEKFHHALETNLKKSIEQYYLHSWIENLAELKCWEVDLDGCHCSSFNTAQDFQDALGIFEGRKDLEGRYLELIEVSSLKHIEGHSPERVEWLKSKILKEGVWNQPIKISREHHLVLDGQHRFEVAMKLGLARVPCQVFDYRDVEIWSLRDDCVVTHDLVIERSLKGDIYPYKTVKHRFRDPIQVCSYPIETLQKGNDQ